MEDWTGLDERGNLSTHLTHIRILERLFFTCSGKKAMDFLSLDNPERNLDTPSQ